MWENIRTYMEWNFQLHCFILGKWSQASLYGLWLWQIYRKWFYRPIYFKHEGISNWFCKQILDKTEEFWRKRRQKSGCSWDWDKDKQTKGLRLTIGDYCQTWWPHFWKINCQSKKRKTAFPRRKILNKLILSNIPLIWSLK